MPVILSGDFNADPLHRNGVETYDAFVAAGFDDAWAELHKGNPAGGLTWGHDEFLADPSVPMIWRLDVVWYRGCGLVPIESKVLDLALDRDATPVMGFGPCGTHRQLQSRRTAPGNVAAPLGKIPLALLPLKGNRDKHGCGWRAAVARHPFHPALKKHCTTAVKKWETVMGKTQLIVLAVVGAALAGCVSPKVTTSAPAAVNFHQFHTVKLVVTDSAKTAYAKKGCPCLKVC